MGSGHFSTLEHASYTFAVDGVSRALTHQLVRHRIASFNQQSQRYVRFSDGVATVKPESVAAERGGERGVRRGRSDAAVEAYGKLLEAGVPAEDARYLLPNAAETKIVITMNVRELLHFFSPALLQPCAVGDPRHGAPDARAGAAHGAVHLPGRRRALRGRRLPRGEDDLREPVSRG